MTEFKSNELNNLKYRNEWQQLLSCLENNNIENLKALAFNGKLRASKYRSICWAVFLRVLSCNVNDWSEQRQQHRKKYLKVIDDFSINPHSKTVVNDDPLSQSEKSVWNQYFDDQNLLTAIKQDVTRTFPGIEFFRKPHIQETMTNILFYYARQNPNMCYRQGMHEILAPILFVINYDHQSLLQFLAISEDKSDQLLLDVLNPDYFEADSYCLFARLMLSIESYYKITNFKPTADGYFPVQCQNDEEVSSTAEVVIIGQLNLIRDKILAKEDEHLHEHLLKLDIQMHIFGMWLRVLFGREFPFLDLLMLWDAIFADNDKFELPNYIVVAMLIRIRDKLLLSDYTTCLMHLMKYPANADMCLILRHALHLQMPKVYDRPSNAFIYVTLQPENIKSLAMQNNIKPTPLLTRKNKIRTNTYPVGNNEYLHKVSSRDSFYEPRKTSKHPAANTKIHRAVEDPLSRRTQSLKSNNHSNTVNSRSLKTSDLVKGSDENISTDDFSINSPENLRLELQNAQTIITVSRLKLNKYLTTLRKYITRRNSEELNQAVDGIEELCAFLDIKFSIPPTEIPLQVDQAFEATSDLQSPFLLNESSPIAPKKQYKIPNRKMTEAQVKTEFVKILEANRSNFESGGIGNDVDVAASKSENLNISLNDEDIPILFAPSTSLGHNNLNAKTRYEIPDTGFMENTQKVLGTRMNVELTIFKEDHGIDDHEGVPIADPLGLRNS